MRRVHEATIDTLGTVRIWPTGMRMRQSGAPLRRDGRDATHVEHVEANQPALAQRVRRRHLARAVNANATADLIYGGGPLQHGALRLGQLLHLAGSADGDGGFSKSELRSPW